MIDAFTLETAHLLGDALPAMHRIRYKVFVERQNYQVPSYNGMEWDQYDTPAAVYILWRDETGEPGAVARLLPTTRPYMIEELWPALIASGEVPSEACIWEATRFGVDRDLPEAMRKRALGELVCGCLEYGLKNGIREYLSVMPVHIIRNVLRGAGVGVDILGKAEKLGGLPVYAVRIHVTREGLEAARRHYGFDGPVLRIAGDSRPDTSAPRAPQPRAPRSITTAAQRATPDHAANAGGTPTVTPVALTHRPPGVANVNARPGAIVEPCRRRCLGPNGPINTGRDDPHPGWPVPFPPPPFATAPATRPMA